MALDEYATGELVRRKPEDERPTIIVPGQFMPEISEAAWRVIDSLNKKQPMVSRGQWRIFRGSQQWPRRTLARRSSTVSVWSELLRRSDAPLD